MTIGQVIGVNDNVNAHSTYRYDNRKRVTDEYRDIDSTRTTHTHYDYDRLGQRTGEINYVDEAETSYRLYQFTYDYAGQLSAKAGKYVSDGLSVDVAGFFEEKYTRDHAGNVVSKQILNGDDYDSTTYHYDHRNRLVKMIEPFGTDGSRKTTDYTYDKTGRLLIESLLVLGMAVRTSSEYDGLGRRTKTTDGLGSSTRYLYDPNGNLLKVVDPRYIDLPVEQAPGMVYEYDPNNRQVKAIAFDGETGHVIAYKEYDGRGNVRMEADATGYNESQPSASIGAVYTYDANNNRVSVTTAQMAEDNRVNGKSDTTFTYVYDAIGNRLSSRDAAGNETNYLYCLNGILKEIRYPDGSKEHFDYDRSGKAFVSKTDQAGYVTKTSLNIYDQPYLQEYPDGTKEQFRFSTRGQVVKAIDRAGNEKRYVYDRAGNQIEVEEYIGIRGDDTVWKRTVKTFDEAGRMIASETFEIIHSAGGQQLSAVSAGDLTEQVYDLAGRVMNINGPAGKQTFMEYDRAGNLTAKKELIANNDFRITRYGYDFRSQLTSESLLINPGDLANDVLAKAKFDKEYVDRALATTVYSYYWNGSLQSITDASGHKTIFEYDRDSRLTKKIPVAGCNQI